MSFTRGFAVSILEAATESCYADWNAEYSMYTMKHSVKMTTEVSIVLRFSFRRYLSSFSGEKKKVRYYLLQPWGSLHLYHHKSYCTWNVATPVQIHPCEEYILIGSMAGRDTSRQNHYINTINRKKKRVGYGHFKFNVSSEKGGNLSTLQDMYGAWLHRGRDWDTAIAIPAGLRC